MKLLYAVPARRVVRQPSESPAFRACRRRTAELLADNRRLEFLRFLDMSAAPLTAGEFGFLQGLLECARRRHYHYVFSLRERAITDGLQRTYGMER